MFVMNSLFSDFRCLELSFKRNRDKEWACFALYSKRVSEIFCLYRFMFVMNSLFSDFRCLELNFKRNRDQEWACFALQTPKSTEALDQTFRRRTSHFVVSKICSRMTKHLQAMFVCENQTF